MALWIRVVLLASSLVFHATSGQQDPNTPGCGQVLNDIPNPASDSCTAFYRCYNYRQYSLRCPLGKAFDFDRSRCRPATEIDCPLQLQRFQAPAVPSYLRPSQEPQEREVQIRVVQVPQGTDPNTLQIFNNGRQVPVNRQVYGPASPIFPSISTGANPQTAQQQQQLVQARSALGQVIQDYPPQQTQGQGQGYLPIFVPGSALTSLENGNSNTDG